MAGPLKVLILGRDTDVFSSAGGAPNDTHERHVRYVKELLRRRPGSEVRIIVHSRRPDGKRFEEPIPGMRIYGTFSRTRLGCPIDMARLMRRFAREGWVPDVVSCQTGYEEAPLALLLADKSSRIQVQVHADFFGESYTRGTLVQRLQHAVIRRSLRRCDQARVVSTDLARSVIENGDIDASRVAVAPVPNVFDAMPHRPDPSRPVVLFVGRLVPQKDLGLWCDAAELVHARLPDAEFWIVGEGPDRQLVESRAAALDRRLRLFGAVRYADLPGIFAQASVFLLSSAYEGLPRVAIETMSAGVPLVSTDISGMRDVVADGRTGRLVPRDAQRLAEAVIGLIEDRRLAGEIAGRARRWTEDNFSFAAVAAKLIDSWEQAATLPKRSR